VRESCISGVPVGFALSLWPEIILTKRRKGGRERREGGAVRFLAQKPFSTYLNVPSPWIIGMRERKKGGERGGEGTPLGPTLFLIAYPFFLGIIIGGGKGGRGREASVSVAVFIPP